MFTYGPTKIGTSSGFKYNIIYKKKFVFKYKSIYRFLNVFINVFNYTLVNIINYLKIIVKYSYTKSPI